MRCASRSRFPRIVHSPSRSCAQLVRSCQAPAIASLQASICKERAAATKAGDSKKQAQMASKQKKLSERHGLEVNAKCHRFKLNRDRAGYHHSLRDEVAVRYLAVTCCLLPLFLNCDAHG